MIQALFNLRGLGASVVIGIIIGSFGAYKITGAAQAKKDKKIAQQALQSERLSHEETMQLMVIKDDLVKVLTDQAKQSQTYINDLQNANVELATRLPRDTVRYIERGKEIADELVLQGGNDCLRYVVPNSLRRYANGHDLETQVSVPANF